jgi:hypothetical protein
VKALHSKKVYGAEFFIVQVAEFGGVWGVIVGSLLGVLLLSRLLFIHSCLPNLHYFQVSQIFTHWEQGLQCKKGTQLLAHEWDATNHGGGPSQEKLDMSENSF